MLEHDLPKREPLMLTVPTTDFGSCLYVAKCQRLTIRSSKRILHYAYLQNLVKLCTMILTRLEVWASSFPLCECIR